MGSTISILENKLKPFADAAHTRMNEAIKASIQQKAQAILTMAQILCPVSVAGHEGASLKSRNHPPGTLRDSLYMKLSSGGHFASIGSDTKKAFYNFMVHFGTVHVAPRPFLYQAKERVVGNGGAVADSIGLEFDKGGSETQ